MRRENRALLAGRQNLSLEYTELLDIFYRANVLIALSGKRDWHLTRGNKMTSTKQAMEKRDYAYYPHCANIIYKNPGSPVEDDVRCCQPLSLPPSRLGVDGIYIYIYINDMWEVTRLINYVRQCAAMKLGL